MPPRHGHHQILHRGPAPRAGRSLHRRRARRLMPFPAVPGGFNPPRFVVSACLLGRRSRYDGGHKLLPGLAEELSRVGAVVLPVCPEADAGLPVPRPPMDLHPAPDGALRLLSADGRDFASLLSRWIDSSLPRLLLSPLTAAILKTKSPSCGATRPPEGLFAAALRRACPALPFWTELDALARLASLPSRPPPLTTPATASSRPPADPP